ncbi:MAG: hypothetical protein HYX55_09145 [Chloroflexi bacterium]|nr:hypothetical protein [Chloroflexota bacterium]
MNLAHVPRARWLLGVATSALVIAACSGTTSPTPASPRASAAATATISPLQTFGAPPSPTQPDDSSAIVLDPALLAYLPKAVEGIEVKEDVDEAATALNDPALPRIASAVDGAVAVDTGTGNLVYAWIVRLRPGTFTDGDYRQWRDSYDEGACTAAGGVVGRAEATIGGRQSYVTSCVAGLRTYHVWLKDQDILISASSIGDGKFGEKLLEGLRTPT